MNPVNLKCECGYEWTVPPGGYWTNCPKCRKPKRVLKCGTVRSVDDEDAL